jgi:hypothetical protein
MDHPPETTSLLHHFVALKDPKQLVKVVYPLPEILLLILCATIVGAERSGCGRFVSAGGVQTDAPLGRWLPCLTSTRVKVNWHRLYVSSTDDLRQAF